MNNILESAQNIHCIGIYGTGLSALAGILREKGKKITGSDAEGLPHAAKNIDPNIELIIYTAAVPEENIERVEGKKRDIPQLSYPEAVGLLTKEYRTIAICGTHGKTTTTGMVASALQEKVDPTVIVGAEIPELGGKNYRVGKSEYLIMEACEYMRHFLHYEPEMVVLTNIEIDHLDYFDDEIDYCDAFTSFLLKIKEKGSIVANYDDKNVKKVCTEIGKKRSDIKIIPFGKENEYFQRFNLSIPGEHNVYNALSALLISLETKGNSTPEQFIQKLNAFKGAGRRFEEHKASNGTPIIDDYAHHPTAIRAVLRAAREKFGNDAKILSIFQPHQHSRTKKLLSQFAESFTLSDEVIIPNIFTVRDSQEDIEEMTAEKLVKEIQKHHSNTHYGKGLEKTLYNVQSRAGEFDAIIVMGAGDVTTLAKKLRS